MAKNQKNFTEETQLLINRLKEVLNWRQTRISHAKSTSSHSDKEIPKAFMKEASKDMDLAVKLAKQLKSLIESGNLTPHIKKQAKEAYNLARNAELQREKVRKGKIHPQLEKLSGIIKRGRKKAKKVIKRTNVKARRAGSTVRRFFMR